jgi:hypothetical protein
MLKENRIPKETIVLVATAVGFYMKYFFTIFLIAFHRWKTLLDPLVMEARFRWNLVSLTVVQGLSIHIYSFTILIIFYTALYTDISIISKPGTLWPKDHPIMLNGWRRRC